MQDDFCSDKYSEVWLQILSFLLPNFSHALTMKMSLQKILCTSPDGTNPAESLHKVDCHPRALQGTSPGCLLSYSGVPKHVKNSILQFYWDI